MFLALVMRNSVIPQGSILGPLFFYFVYINDLIVNVGSDVHLFADDTSLYYLIVLLTMLNKTVKFVEIWTKLKDGSGVH